MKEITGHTILTGLLGSPVSHSISPLMHNESFRCLDLDYVYLCFDVGEKELEKVTEGLRTLGVRGWNCTMPDKNKMCELVDKLSPAAKMTGSVNTVVNDNGILTGYNTDGIGYMQSVCAAGHNITGKTMTLLGAGGAATSICAQAALDGVKQIHMFSRRNHFFTRAEQLAETISNSTSCKVILHDYEKESELYGCIQDSDILVNATSVGMEPNSDNCLIHDSSVLRPELIVSDIIYNPRETKLLRLAKEQGCQTFNGLYMLLYQGAEAFRLWTGKPMPVEHIKAKYFV